jgi:hypothetical protein
MLNAKAQRRKKNCNNNTRRCAFAFNFILFTIMQLIFAFKAGTILQVPSKLVDFF